MNIEEWIKKNILRVKVYKLELSHDLGITKFREGGDVILFA